MVDKETSISGSAISYSSETDETQSTEKKIETTQASSEEEIFFEPDPDLFCVIDPTCLRADKEKFDEIDDNCEGDFDKENLKTPPRQDEELMDSNGLINFSAPAKVHRCLSPERCKNPNECMQNEAKKSKQTATQSDRDKSNRCPNGTSQVNICKLLLILLTALYILFEIIRICVTYVNNGVDNMYGQLKIARAGAGLTFSLLICIGMCMRNTFCLYIGVIATFCLSWFIAMWETLELITYHNHVESEDLNGFLMKSDKMDEKMVIAAISSAAVIYFIWPLLMLVAASFLHRAWLTEQQTKHNETSSRKGNNNTENNYRNFKEQASTRSSIQIITATEVTESSKRSISTCRSPALNASLRKTSV